MSEALRDYLHRLGWSPGRLASEINRSMNGPSVSSKAPYHWLRGAYPRGDIPGVLAALLSEKLGEPVTIADIWPNAGGKRPRRGPGCTELSGHRCPADIDACTTAVLDWFTELPTGTTSHAPAPNLAPGIVEAMEERCRQTVALVQTHGIELAREFVEGDLGLAHELLARFVPAGRHHTRIHTAVAAVNEAAGRAAIREGAYCLGRRYLLDGLAATDRLGDRSYGARLVAYLCEGLGGCEREALRLLAVASAAVPEHATQTRQLLLDRQAAALTALLEAGA